MEIYMNYKKNKKTNVILFAITLFYVSLTIPSSPIYGSDGVIHDNGASNKIEKRASSANPMAHKTIKNIIKYQINFNIGALKTPPLWTMKSEFLSGKYKNVIFSPTLKAHEKLVKDLQIGLQNGGWSSIDDKSFPLRSHIDIENYRSQRALAQPIYTYNPNNKNDQMSDVVKNLTLSGSIEVNDFLNRPNGNDEMCDGCEKSFFSMQSYDRVELKVKCLYKDDDNSSLKDFFEVSTDKPIIIQGHNYQKITFTASLQDVRNHLMDHLRIQTCDKNNNSMASLNLVCALFPASDIDQNILNQKFKNELSYSYLDKYDNKNNEFLLPIQSEKTNLDSYRYKWDVLTVKFYDLNSHLDKNNQSIVRKDFDYLDDMPFYTPLFKSHSYDDFYLGRKRIIYNERVDQLETWLTTSKDLLFEDDRSLANSFAKRILEVIKDDPYFDSHHHKKEALSNSSTQSDDDEEMRDGIFR